MEKIAPTMKIKTEELGMRIVDLVTKGFITLELSSVDAKEVFSLDETYRRLVFLLEAEDEDLKDEAVKRKIKATVSLLERELKNPEPAGIGNGEPLVSGRKIQRRRH